MQKQKLKVVYSLRVHLELEKQGFKPLSTMQNPVKSYLNCWVYEATPDFLAALDAAIEGGSA